jgi:4-amino-4-deoxy-L-arabinose transferase-like glycosyltransferase
MLYLFFLYFCKKTLWPLAALAFVSGLAVLARPPVLLFVPIILFYFYKNWKTKKNDVSASSHKKSLWHAALFLLIIIAVFLPWTVRNYIVFERFMPFGAAGAFNFWIGNYHGGNGEQEPNKEQIAFMGSHPFKDLQEESMRQFKIFLLKHPAEFVKLTFLRISKYFSIIRPMGFWFYQKGLGQFLFICSSALASIILFITGFGGLVKSVKLKNKAVYYLAAFLAATPLFVFVTVVETRYRFQIYPILAIFAGFFIVHLLEKQKFWLDKILWTMIVVFFGNGLVDLLLSMERFKERISKFL